MFGDNYHTEPIIGFAWGPKVISTRVQILVFTNTDFSKNFSKKRLKVYDFKRAKVLLSHLGITLQNPAFDSRLAKYLLSTVEDNEISTIASLYSQIALLDEVVGKEPKAIPEKDGPIRAFGTESRCSTGYRRAYDGAVASHDQLGLLYDMEQPLAAVLAKMEIAGIKVERQTLEDMQVENEVVLERLTQEIYELAGEEFNINSPKQLGVILFEKLELPLEYTKRPKPAIQQPLMSWNAWLQLPRSCLRFLNTAKLLRSSRPMSSVFKIGFWKMGRSIPAMYRI